MPLGILVLTLASLRVLSVCAALVACASSSSSSSSPSADSAPDVSESVVYGPASPGSGGTIEDGSYVLTRREIHLPPGTQFSNAGEPIGMVFSLSGRKYSYAMKGGLETGSGVFSVSGNTLTLEGDDY